MIDRSRSLAFTLMLATLLGGCAHVRTSYDPIEPVNRATFGFNQIVNRIIVKPTLNIYRAIVPKPVRRRLFNVAQNITVPVTAANQLLQGRPGAALRSVGRVLINTTVGVGGVFDVATDSGLPAAQEDFGQTLGVWGVPQGPYIVLPVLGPSSVRDTFGKVVDTVSDPLFWVLRGSNSALIRNANTRRALGRTQFGLDGVTQTDAFFDELEELQKSVDPYTALRESWRQAREADVRNGELPKAKADDPLNDVLGDVGPAPSDPSGKEVPPPTAPDPAIVPPVDQPPSQDAHPPSPPKLL